MKRTKRTHLAPIISNYTSADLIKDPETSAALTASQMDMITSSISSGETGGNGGTLISLADGTENRICTANPDNSATVAITYAGSDARSVGKATVTTTRSGSENRIWSKTDGTAITCNTNQRAKINWTSSSINGLNLLVATERVNDITKSFNNVVGISSTVGRINKIAGSRLIKWKDYSSKSIISSFTSSLSITGTTGAIKVLDYINEVKSDNPLIIETIRNSSTGKPTAQTIVSGINYSKKTAAFSMTSEFSNLAYDTMNTDVCSPISGTITMKIYSDDSFVNLAQTNIITYKIGIPSVSTDGTVNTDFTTYLGNHTNHNCDLAQGN